MGLPVIITLTDRSVLFVADNVKLSLNFLLYYFKSCSSLSESYRW